MVHLGKFMRQQMDAPWKEITIRRKLPQKQYLIFIMAQESINNVKQMLLLEFKLYQQFAGQQCFPNVFCYSEKQSFSYLAMEKFEITLDAYAAKLYPNTFLPKDCLLTIMNQTLAILQTVHQKGYLYRDVKPGNFMLKAPYNRIYIIDFGLSKSFLNNGKHITEKVGKKLVGTPLFCSINTHIGKQQSRRDDIQCWIYTMLYLAMNLPWESVLKNKLNNEEQYSQIGLIKMSTEWNKIIKQHQEVPQSFSQIMEIARSLEFDQEPNYQKIFDLIASQYKRLCGQSIENGVKWKSQISKKEEPKKKINKINFKVKQIATEEKKRGSLTQKQNIGNQSDNM